MQVRNCIYAAGIRRSVCRRTRHAIYIIGCTLIHVVEPLVRGPYDGLLYVAPAQTLLSSAAVALAAPAPSIAIVGFTADHHQPFM